MALEVLAARAAEFGCPLEANQLAAFGRYRSELLAWNERANLTAITEPAAVELRHFVDSLSCLQGFGDLLADDPAPRLIDVGSGGGFPGLPLKLAQPRLALTLVDSVGKKTEFLRHLVAVLGLQGVEVITARAEDLARDPARREQYTVVVSRALAALPVLLELCLPFARVGGRLVAPRRGDLTGQQAEAAGAALELGGSFRPAIAIDLAPGLGDLGLVVVEKVAPTPSRYPRRVGIPSKRPLR